MAAYGVSPRAENRLRLARRKLVPGNMENFHVIGAIDRRQPMKRNPGSMRPSHGRRPEIEAKKECSP